MQERVKTILLRAGRAQRGMAVSFVMGKTFIYNRPPIATETYHGTLDRQRSDRDQIHGRGIHASRSSMRSKIVHSTLG